MSSSRMVFEGRRQHGKSNFVQTCNLLSKYIKEKGCLRDLNIEIGGRVESLEAIVKTELTHPASASAAKSSIPMGLQPNTPPTTSKEDPKPSQLTIFYSGKMLVFDDFPAEKAKELMSFAKKESSQMSYGIMSTANPSPMAPISRDALPPRPQASSSSHKGAGISSNICAAYPEANGSDLPIARRSSLHRFLGKRKDRAAARGPYHQVEEQAGISLKGDEQLELKL